MTASQLRRGTDIRCFAGALGRYFAGSGDFCDAVKLGSGEAIAGIPVKLCLWEAVKPKKWRAAPTWRRGIPPR